MKAILLSAVLLLASTSTFAATHDFSSLASGTAVTNQFSGVTFSLGGGGVTSGAPVISNGGIANSTTLGYPTADYLIAEFDTAVSDVSFNFNNWGDNSSYGGTIWTAFNSLGSSIGTGSLATASGGLTSLAMAGITKLVWDNNLTGRDSWIFALESISFTASPSAVPLPAAAFLFGPALLGFMGLRRKAKNSVA